MEEESVKKRRRLNRGAPPKDDAAPSLAAISFIDSVPDAVLQQCFSFLGKGHYRYVAGTSRRFNEIYAINHEKKTARKNAVVSVACAEHFLQDGRERCEELTKLKLSLIFKHAAEMGNVKVLKWAHDMKGHEPEERDFLHAVIYGRVAVLQWAEENDIDWYSDKVVYFAAHEGHVHILEWVHSTGREIPVDDTSRIAVSFGQGAVLDWLKEHDLLGSIQDLWRVASCRGLVHVLDWLFENGYRAISHVIHAGIIRDHRDVLLWAREHGIAWDAATCSIAAYYGKLPMLQWLRENDCPWDSTVIVAAQREGREDIEQWAIDNGCPTE